MVNIMVCENLSYTFYLPVFLIFQKLIYGGFGRMYGNNLGPWCRQYRTRILHGNTESYCVQLEASMAVKLLSYTPFYQVQKLAWDRIHQFQAWNYKEEYLKTTVIIGTHLQRKKNIQDLKLLMEVHNKCSRSHDWWSSRENGVFFFITKI